LELKNIWIEKTIVSKHESHKIDISGVLYQITLLENLLIKTFFEKCFAFRYNEKLLNYCILFQSYACNYFFSNKIMQQPKMSC